MQKHNSQLHETLLEHIRQLQQHQGNTINIRYVSHEQFKQQTVDSQAVIRSGECSPFYPYVDEIDDIGTVSMNDIDINFYIASWPVQRRQNNAFITKKA